MMDIKTLFIEELGWDNLTQSLTITLTEPGQLLPQWGKSNKREKSPVPVRRFGFALEGIAVKRGLPVFVCSPYKQGQMPPYLMRCEITRRVCSRMTHALIIFHSDAGQHLWQWRRLRDDGTALYCEHFFDATYPPETRTVLASITFAPEEEDSITFSEVLRRVEQAVGFDRVRQTKHWLRLNEMDLSGESEWLRSWVKMAYRRRGVAHFEERKLITEAQQGCPSAWGLLVEAHLYLPLELGWKMKQRQSVEMPLEDLVHEGYLGLHDAVRTYTFREEKRFQQHAAIWVHRNMTRAVQEKEGLISHPIYIQDTYAANIRQYDSIEDTLIQVLERPPTTQEMARALGIPADKLPLVQQMREGVQRVGIAIEDEDSPPFEALAEEIRRRGIYTQDWIARLMTTLNENQRNVVRLRFGLDNTGEYTLDEIGQSLGVTRERVRQIESSALTKMRKAVHETTLKQKRRT